MIQPFSENQSILKLYTRYIDIFVTLQLVNYFTADYTDLHLSTITGIFHITAT